MHGVVAKKDGSIVEISIGEDAEDPVLYITDLLIHLSGKQLQKKAAEVIEGEMLDIPVSYTHLDVYKRQPWTPEAGKRVFRRVQM